MLASKGKDLRQEPIVRRKAALRKLLDEPPTGVLYVDSVEDGARLFGHALTLGLEGVVAKRAGSVYLSGERLRDWMKVKRLGAMPPQRFKR